MCISLKFHEQNRIYWGSPSIHYPARGQAPEIYASLVKLTKTNSTFIIEIADTGTGVPIEDLPKLFDPFYRVAQARDRATGGTGLGMAIAKQAVVAHNGNISAQNNNQNGLTVTIELPTAIGKNSRHKA